MERVSTVRILHGAIALRACTYVDETVVRVGPESVVASHVHTIVAEATLVLHAFILELNGWIGLTPW